MCHVASGLGWSTVLIAFLVALYYNVIIAWTLLYLAVSLVPLFTLGDWELPWKRCDNHWNSLSLPSVLITCKRHQELLTV